MTAERYGPVEVERVFTTSEYRAFVREVRVAVNAQAARELQNCIPPDVWARNSHTFCVSIPECWVQAVERNVNA